MDYIFQMVNPWKIAVFLLAALVWPDTLVMDYSGPHPTGTRWDIDGTMPFSISQDPDFEGGVAFKLANSRPTSNRAPRWCTGRLPFRKAFWIRYHFKFVIDTTVQRSADSIDAANLIALSFSEVREPRQPSPDIVFLVRPQKGGGRQALECKIRPSIDERTFHVSTLPLDDTAFNCFEAKVDFPAKDTLAFEWFLNGRSAGSSRTPYFFNREFIGLGLVHPGRGRGVRDLVFGDFRIGPERHYTHPSPPKNRRETVAGDSVILLASHLTDRYKGEKAVVVRWLLLSAGIDGRTVLDQTIRDPLFFDSLPVPFPLDKGDYGWKVRILNNFGNWGPWSDERRFSVTRERRLTERILGAWLTPGKEDRSPPRLDTIHPGYSYRFNIRFRPETGWDSLGYIIAGLHHAEYTQGNPGNRGGVFIPESNYVANISFGPKFPSNVGDIKLLERAPGSHASRNWSRGDKGIYLGLEKGALFLDTGNGTVSFSIRLSDSMKCGPWMFSVYARDAQERLSNTFTGKVWAVPAVPGSGFRWWWAITAAGAILAGIRILRRIKAKRLIRETQDMARIRQYIMDHLQEEMSFDSIRKDLNLAVHRFHKILAENGATSIPKLINQIRIQKAQDLLKQPEKSISEIGFEVGFADASYFTRIFREITGKTPTEYRSAF